MSAPGRELRPYRGDVDKLLGEGKTTDEIVSIVGAGITGKYVNKRRSLLGLSKPVEREARIREKLRSQLTAICQKFHQSVTAARRQEFGL